MKIVIIGAGVAGLAAAYDLAGRGHEVDVVEAGPVIGGQVRTFEVGGGRLESFYHHLFLSDTEIVALLGELGLGDELQWIDSNVGLHAGGKAYPFVGPVDLLRFDQVSLITRVRLGLAALWLRRQTDWHRRLHFCAMSLLLGPGFGRLLPMPLLTPWAWEATVVACLAFPAVAMWADWRRGGRVHPAWGWGVAAILGATLLTEAITYSPVGGAIYRAVVAGSPGVAVAPLDFPPPPGPPPRAS